MLVPKLILRSKTVKQTTAAALLLGVFLLAGCGELPVEQALQKAQADLDGGRPAAAIKRLERLQAKYPQNWNVKETLAWSYLKGGNAAKAGEIFNELGLAQSADSHLWAAQAYRQANDPQKAIEAYRLYLLNEPGQAGPWQELGELLIAQDKKSEGLIALGKAQELNPSPTLSYRIGQLYAQMGNRVQAERYWQASLRQARGTRTHTQAPTAQEEAALEALVGLALDQKESLKAERYLRQLDRDFPKNEDLPALKERQAKIRTPQIPLVEKKPEPEVKTPELPVLPSKTVSPKPLPTNPEEALKEDNSHAASWASLAAAKAKAGDLAWAEAAYLEAMRLDPGQDELIVAYLEVVKKRRSPAEYLQECERQRQKYPQNAELTLITARGYRDLMQNKRNARALLTKFLQDWPTHPQAGQARAELEALK